MVENKGVKIARDLNWREAPQSTQFKIVKWEWKEVECTKIVPTIKSKGYIIVQNLSILNLISEL